MGNSADRTYGRMGADAAVSGVQNLPKRLRANRAMTDNQKAAGGRNRLLIVDDDAEIRRMLMRLMEAEGYQVSEAATGPGSWLPWKTGCDRTSSSSTSCCPRRTASTC